MGCRVWDWHVYISLRTSDPKMFRGAIPRSTCYKNQQSSPVASVPQGTCHLQPATSHKPLPPQAKDGTESNKRRVAKSAFYTQKTTWSWGPGMSRAEGSRRSSALSPVLLGINAQRDPVQQGVNSGYCDLELRVPDQANHYTT